MNYKVINKMCNIFDYYIIDLRDEKEFNLFHVINSVNINIKNIQYLDIDRNTCILLYCNTGVVVKEAIDILYSKGYINLYIYKIGSISCFEKKHLT